MSVTEITVVTGSHAHCRAACAHRIAHRLDGIRVTPLLASDRDDSAAALERAIDARTGVHMVVELPSGAAIDAAIGTLEAEPDVTIAETVCVIDAASFFADLLVDDYLPVAGTSPTLYVARALRTVQCVEHASTILVAEWEDVETRDLSMLLAVLSHLAPAARLRLERDADDAPPAPFSLRRHQPGWVHLLNGDHRPHMTDLRVSAFRYEQLRPFHPGRLHELLETSFGGGAFGAVLRSAGFCRLATRTGLVGSWDQVGQMISLEPLARDEHGLSELLALGQDIGFIGIDLDAAALTAALDRAALSDAEFTAGTREWARFADPFPRWETGGGATE